MENLRGKKSMTEKDDKPVMINIAVRRLKKAQGRVDTNRTEAEFIWKEQKFTGKDNSVASDSGETPKKIGANGIEKFNEGK